LRIVKNGMVARGRPNHRHADSVRCSRYESFKCLGNRGLAGLVVLAGLSEYIDLGGEVLVCIRLLKPRSNLPNLLCAVLSR